METIQEIKEGFHLVLKTYNTTGECEVHINVVVKLWNSNWYLAQWHDKFTLVEEDKGKRLLKVQISEVQAYEIIKGLKLKCFKSSLFRYAKTWKLEELYKIN